MSRRIFYIKGAVSATCSDSDVDAFFAVSDMSEANLASWLTAIGKNYAQVKSYVCNFVTTIKAAGFTGTNAAMYLPIGFDATRRKYNFWNPADSDTAFRLTFNGGISFTNFAIVGNGINGYSDTHWVPLAQSSTSAASFAIDSGSDISGVSMVMGAFTNPSRRMFVNLGSTPSGNIQIADASAILYSGTRKGLFVSRRNGVNANESFRDGVSIGSNTAVWTPPAGAFYLNALNNNGVAALFATHPVNFAYLSPQGWSDAQVAALQSAYTQLKTDLGIV